MAATTSPTASPAPSVAAPRSASAPCSTTAAISPSRATTGAPSAPVLSSCSTPNWRSMRCPPAVESEAQRIAARLAQNGRSRHRRAGPTCRAAMSTPWTWCARGRSASSMPPCGRSNSSALLAELGLTGPQRAAALGTLVSRMAAPGSELVLNFTLREMRLSNSANPFVRLDGDCRNAAGETVGLPAASPPRVLPASESGHYNMLMMTSPSCPTWVCFPQPSSSTRPMSYQV